LYICDNSILIESFLYQSMKNRFSKDNVNDDNPRSIRGSGSKKMKKNKMRLGGKGLSLEVFANAKTKSDHYNPAIIKKQREFYKNAKYVSKYKKSLKNLNQPNAPSLEIRSVADGNESGKAGEMNQENRKNKKHSERSLKVLYEKKCKEDEKARMERDAIAKAKKEARERSESQRKAHREKMFKKTKSGQPVMKYRIEHLLETIQGSNT